MRRENELFIGREFMNVEGRSIKHPSLIKHFASVNMNKIHDEPIKLVGLDLETNHLTAELKLLGFYDGIKYAYYTKDFLEVIFSYIRYAKHENIAIAYWNRLDPFVIFRQFLQRLTEEQVKRSLKRFGNVSGEWDRKKGKWKVDPVVEVEYSNWCFGIKNAIRSSIQFFYYDKGDPQLKTVWAYDIAQLYLNGLEKEATKRLPYYSKVDKSAHLVEWDRFESDEFYRNDIVLKSNELDAKAVRDLGIMIQEEFKTAFGYFPRSLISQGSLARASIVAKIIDKYKDIEDEAERNRMAVDDIKSIGFINYYDEWLEKYGEFILKDLFALTTEAYSGGYIEAIRLGYSESAYYSDLASAYPSIEVELYDLRNAKITTGKGSPPIIDKSYCFIRGKVEIPEEVQYHPLTIKHPIHKETNIRAVGDYIASYTIEERNYLLSLGATFTEETWYNIETSGHLSPLAEVIKEFIHLREKLKAENNSAEYMAKISANSAYGILFEATMDHEDFEDDVINIGYRAGEFFNPIFATYITANTRIKLARASNEIEKQGGKVLLLMTDSVFWQGSPEMLPKDMIREVKTLGYFEPPQEVKNFLCLGSGRYGYENENGYVQAKKRGLNATGYMDEQGIMIEDFSWLEALKSAVRQDSEYMYIKVRTLVSVGLIAHSLSFTYNDLGKVIEQERQVEIITGRTKRFFFQDDIKVEALLKGLIETKSLVISQGMLGKGEEVDQTLPLLRSEMMKKTAISRKEKTRK